MPRLKYHDYFEPDNFYHVYNRSVNEDTCFKSDENYVCFLKRFSKHILPYTGVYAYCLMPTHFHFLLKIKEDTTNELLEGQFKKLLSGYSLAINKENSRHGSLFQKSFKRINVDSDEYLNLLIHYIHHNPIHHGYVKEFSAWKYSSYNAIIGNQATLVRREEVIELFKNREIFMRFHEEAKNYHVINKLTFD